MIVGHPTHGVVQEEVPYGVAVGPIEIEGRTQGDTVPVREVRPEVTKGVALGTKVVVDHIQDHGHALPVTRINQTPESVRPSIGVLYGVGIDPVVAPVPIARKLGHRHQLHGGDAQGLEVGQTRDDRIKGAGLGKGPHVELIDDQVAKGDTPPIIIGPGETRVIHDHTGPTHPTGLKEGSGVRTFHGPIELIHVPGTRSHIRSMRPPEPKVEGVHVDEPFLRLLHVNPDLLGEWRPDREGAALVRLVGRSLMHHP